MTTMCDRDISRARSHFHGHPIVFQDAKWLYADTLQPIPGYGGEMRPCAVCGTMDWSGDGKVDPCLGLLPGVDNACCGHGVAEQAYIRFTNGVVVRGFSIIENVDGLQNSF